MTQPADRRLLTEAAGNATYGTKTEVADLDSRKVDTADLGGHITTALAEDSTVIQAAADAMAFLPDGALTYNTVAREKDLYDSAATYRGGDIVTHDGDRYYAAAGEGQVTVTRTNLVPNPRFASNRAGWTVTTDVTGTVEGTALRLAATGDKAATTSLLLSSELPATTGDTMSASVKVTVPAGKPAVSVRAQLTYYPTPDTPVFAVESIQPGETKTIIVAGSTVPAGKSGVRINVMAGTTPILAGSEVIVSEPLIEVAPTPGGYFDGETTDTATAVHSWAGTPDNSASTAEVQQAVDPTFGEPGVDPKWVRFGVAESGAVDPEVIEGTVKTLTAKHESGYSGLIPTTTQAEQTRPLGYVGGVFYGTASGGAFLRKSTDQGRTWTDIGAVTAAGSAYVASLLDAGDGEVLLVAEDQILKSSGWSTDPATATWASVLTAPAPSKFHAYGVDTDPATGRCFATTYANNANGPDWSSSRYGWLSTDYGVAWAPVWDKNTRLASPDLASKSHNHLAAIDPWANGRLWISWHTDGTPKQHEVCYSDTDGATWTAITTSHQPQSGCAAKHGMVFGSDDAENGIHVVERTPDPADMVYRWAWEWKNSKPGFLVGHSNRSFRDNETGNVFTGFMVSITGGVATSTIAESNGRTAWGVWEHPDAAHYSSGEGIRGRLVAGQGVVMAWGWWDSANQTVILGRTDQTVQAPNGTNYRLGVDNSGNVTATPV